MGKLFTPQDISSGFNTTNSLNTNFDNIETALDRTLSRYGEAPNAMAATLDMNDNPIINAGAIDCSSITIDGLEIPSVADLAAQAAIAAAQVTLAQAAVVNAQTAQTAAELAETNAEAAQAAAELAAASVGLPVIGLGDSGNILRVNALENGYDLTDPLLDNEVTTTKIANDAITSDKINPSVYLTGNISLSVEAVPAGATQFATITAAIDYVRTTYIPAGGTVTITQNKTAITSGNDDRLIVKQGEDLSHITLSMPAGTYNLTDAFSPFISVLDRGRGPKVEAAGAVVLAANRRLANVARGGYLHLTGGSFSMSGLTSGRGVEVNGGGAYLEVSASDINITSSVFSCVYVAYGATLHIGTGATMTLTTTSTAAPALQIYDGALFHADGALVINASGSTANSSEVFRRGSLQVNSFTGTVAATYVAVFANKASVINLNGSTATCNLTDNTVSSDGILIR